jgi:hypothetical protein
MKMHLIRVAAFVVGSMIAGCVYATHQAAPAKGDAIVSPQLATYPGAMRTHGDRDGDSADTSVDLPMVHLRFTAVRYDTSDAPPKVEAFYRKALASLGPVGEQRGGPHSKISGFVWRQGPGQMTLHSGHTIVGIAPHGSGAEFAIITIDATHP